MKGTAKMSWVTQLQGDRGDSKVVTGQRLMVWRSYRY